MDAPLRKGLVELRPMESADFLPLLYRHSKSKETGSRIRSQYEKEFKERSDAVGTLGLYCCEEVVGGITFSHRPFPYEPEFFSARLDTVLTVPKFRGMGLGRILMSGLFLHSVETLGDKLHRYSTVALHPSVEHFVKDLGFEGLEESDTPLYAIDLGDKDRRDEFESNVRRAYSLSLQSVREQCMVCMHRPWSPVWCRPKEQKRSA
ncbi:MAG: GNAT superfamily N-acetyltransferase [Candidatus Paceibacteria bacterium]|jgi:GNAT superfamily N-acetyltransferase